MADNTGTLEDIWHGRDSGVRCSHRNSPFFSSAAACTVCAVSSIASSGKPIAHKYSISGIGRCIVPPIVDCSCRSAKVTRLANHFFFAIVRFTSTERRQKEPYSTSNEGRHPATCPLVCARCTVKYCNATVFTHVR